MLAHVSKYGEQNVVISVVKSAPEFFTLILSRPNAPLKKSYKFAPRGRRFWFRRDLKNDAEMVNFYRQGEEASEMPEGRDEIPAVL